MLLIKRGLFVVQKSKDCGAACRRGQPSLGRCMGEVQKVGAVQKLGVVQKVSDAEGGSGAEAWSVA